VVRNLGTVANPYPRPGACPFVGTVRPRVDVRRPPRDLDLLVDWFEQVCYQLVLIVDWPLEDIQGAVAVFSSSVAAHITEAEPTPTGSSADNELGQILSADHRWFATSVDQLGWFLRVVETEDHGGHRQALGQYGRVFAEAVRRHRTDERRFFEERKGSNHPDHVRRPGSTY
jgi:hypothetical protein